MENIFNRFNIVTFIVAISVFLLYLLYDEGPVILQVKELPKVTFQSSKDELAALETPYAQMYGLPSVYQAVTKNRIASGYAYSVSYKEKVVKIPGDWEFSWSNENSLRDQAVAKLKRGENIIEIVFEQKGFFGFFARIFGQTPQRVYGVIDLNSRYLAVEGSGSWQYRFIDKLTGEVLPFAIAPLFNQAHALMVDNRGIVYYYPHQDYLTPVMVTNSDKKELTNGIRTIQYQGKSLESVLTHDQINQWVKPTYR